MLSFPSFSIHSIFIVMSALLALIGFLITIAVVVTVHEGGHCFMAKLLGVKVLRFSIGMGKVIWSKQKGETQYCISMLPLGGYVSMLDEEDPEQTLTPEDRACAYSSQPRWKKALILFAGPAVNFVLAFVLFAAVGAIGTPDLAPVMGTPPAKSQAAAEGIREGDRLLRVDGVRIEGLSDLSLELTNKTGEGKVAMTFLRDGEEFTRHFSMAGMTLDDLAAQPAAFRLGLYPFMRDPMIRGVLPSTPAEKAGVRAGDRVLTVNGAAVTSVQETIDKIGASTGDVVLSVENIEARGEIRTIVMTPEEKDGRRLIGVTITAMPEFVTVRLSPLNAVLAGWNKVKKITVMQVKGVQQMATGEASTKNLSGPLAIADMAGSAVQSGVVPFLEYLALISVAIGFMNLLPVPALDGGQLTVLALEALRGRDFSARTRMNITRTGFFLMLLLFVVVMNNDVTRLFG